MDFQKSKIIDELFALGWTETSVERPQSISYWWLWEIIEFTNNENQNLYISFLIDFQLSKKKSNVNAVGFSNIDPKNYSDAIEIDLFYFGSNWCGELQRIVRLLDKNEKAGK